MAMTEVEKSIQEKLSLPILLAERVIKFAKEAESFKPENNDLATQVAQTSQQLRAVARLTTASAVIYDRPIRRVTADITKSLDRVLALSRKCRHKKTNVLRHVLSIITTNDFKKVSNLLDSSLADVRWLLSIFNPDSENGTINLSLPPIASNDPILAWVWSNIAAVQMGRSEAAQDLALAGDNDRTKKVIVEENGIPPLLKLLKENVNSDAQNAAANALYNLADDQERVEVIANALGVQIIAKALSVAQIIVLGCIEDLCYWVVWIYY
ncbi:armadillo repeat only 4 [Abeliophyllum distichum]|uniref:Armadillo repeat only 4 n=1 Tax=Abeliophyllum distichum TaxID=126358 RepID=A0ABD1S0J4_9LAMI